MIRGEGGPTPLLEQEGVARSAGVVDQIHIEESLRGLDLPPRPHFVRAPLLFQEGSWSSCSSNYFAQPFSVSDTALAQDS